MSAADDLRFMRRALALADSRLGHTWPNPSVGVVIVQGNEIVGEGVTGDGGRPHGEEMALALKLGYFGADDFLSRALGMLP